MPQTPEQFSAALDSYTAAREAILYNPNLSEAGRHSEVDAHYKTALEAITQHGDEMWGALETEFNSANERLRREAAKSSGSFDYNRLAYEAGAMASAIAGRRGKELVEMYDKLHTAGDPHRLKAFRDSVPGLVEGRLHNSDDDGREVRHLVSRIQSDVAAEENTPGLQQAQAEAAALADRILEAQRATQRAVSTLGLSNSLFGSRSSNPLVGWLNRVQIEREEVGGVVKKGEAKKVKVKISFKPKPADVNDPEFAEPVFGIRGR